jgi:hypothetical protein
MSRYTITDILLASGILIALLLSGCTPTVQAAPVQVAPVHVPAQTIPNDINIPSGVVVTISGGWLPNCESSDTICINNAREGIASGYEDLRGNRYRIYNERGETLYWLSWEKIEK